MKISQEVFEKIEKEKIGIKPRSYFIFCAFSWILAGGIIFFASVLFIAVCFFYFNVLKIWFFLISNPLSWSSFLFFLFFLLVVGLIVIVALFYRKARSCCRHENWTLFSFLLIGAFVIGFLFYQSKLFKEKKIILSQKNIVNIEKYWSDIHKGRFSGNFDSFLSEEKVMIIYDGQNKKWKVATNGCRYPKNTLQKGDKIKLIGNLVEARYFIAKQIWRWDE